MANWYEPTPDAREAWRQWVAERPPVVREVAERFPPWTLYRLHDPEGNPTKQRVYVLSFQEEHCGCGDCCHRPHVTLTVAVDGRFNLVAAERGVRGIVPERLVECDLPGPDEPTGSMGLSVEMAAALHQLRTGKPIPPCEDPGCTMHGGGPPALEG
jgi:hypothetical protein